MYSPLAKRRGRGCDVRDRNVLGSPLAFVVAEEGLLLARVAYLGGLLGPGRGRGGDHGGQGQREEGDEE